MFHSDSRFSEIVSNLDTVAIVIAGDLPEYWRIISEIVEEVHAVGGTPLILDVSPDLLKCPVSIHSEWVVRRLRCERFRDRCLAMATDLGCIFETLCVTPVNIEIPDSPPNFRSSVLTMLRDPTPPRRRYIETLRDFEQEYIAVRQALESHQWEGSKPTKFFIPNGRFPYQVAIADSTVTTQSAIFYYELGWQEDHYYIGVMPQNAVNTIPLQEKVLEDVDISDQRRGQAWTKRRIASFVELSQIVTSKQRHSGPAERFSSNTDRAPLAILFTSSADEVLPQDEQYGLTNVGWENIYHAYASALPVLESAGFQVIIRQHPNTASKTVRAVFRELWRLGRLAGARDCCTVLAFNDRQNSYELAATADLVIVWHSTIGIESMCLGVPVVCMASSWWSRNAGIDPATGPSAFYSAILEAMGQNTTLDDYRATAHRAIGYQFRNEVSFRSTLGDDGWQLLQRNGSKAKWLSRFAWAMSYRGRYFQQYSLALLWNSWVGRAVVMLVIKIAGRYR